MKRTNVDSSAIASVGYHTRNKVLEIEFKSGNIYEYYRVPALEFRKLMKADSHGTYFVDHIRNGFQYRRVR